MEIDPGSSRLGQNSTGELVEKANEGQNATEREQVDAKQVNSDIEVVEKIEILRAFISITECLPEYLKLNLLKTLSLTPNSIQ